ncbi:DUF4145 domain-containing protein [Nocardioides sp. SYSU DS0663]|uniref:DUF4145 domain-containing protein n=1 Tax=Nocardioides sp. SYSU DS0663 TaxID=3416445 RepID=UPI003F4C7B9F
MTRLRGPYDVEPRVNNTFLIQALFKCDECNWLQIGSAVRPSQPAPGHSWDETRLQRWFEKEAEIEWIPAVGSAPVIEDVPPHIADAATEAYRCFSIEAYRAAGAMARAVIEASAKEKGIVKGRLFDKIEQMEKDQHIRPYVREAAHEVRHLGNDVAHGDFVEPIEAEEAEEALALMSEVLQEVFQSPARVQKARNRREAKKSAREAGR